MFIVHNLNNQNKQDQFNLLRKIGENSRTNQRILAKDLGLSLGKLNYCLHSLKKKGLIKINNFSKNKKKLNYLYLLTPKGILTKSELTYRFLKIKVKEYEELQKN